MCQKCNDALDRLFPGSTNEEKRKIIFMFTPFPLGSPEQIIAALEAEAKRRATGATPEPETKGIEHAE